MSLWVVWAKVQFVEVLAGKVNGLSWEITHDVSEITSPEGTDTLLGNNSLEAVSDTDISVFWGDVLVGILDLKEELDSLDWGDDSLGDCGGNSSDEEIGEEGFLLLLNLLCAHYFLSICSIVIKVINYGGFVFINLQFLQ